jgi:hypothetical protein
VLETHSSYHDAEHRQAAQLPCKQHATSAHAGLPLKPPLLLLLRHPTAAVHTTSASVVVAHSYRQCQGNTAAQQLGQC